MASTMMILRVEDLNKLVSVSDASMLTGIHIDTIRKWLREKRITRYGTRRCYRVHLAELLPVSPRKAVKEPREYPVSVDGEFHTHGAVCQSSARP